MSDKQPTSDWERAVQQFYFGVSKVEAGRSGHARSLRVRSSLAAFSTPDSLVNPNSVRMKTMNISKTATMHPLPASIHHAVDNRAISILSPVRIRQALHIGFRGFAAFSDSRD